MKQNFTKNLLYDFSKSYSCKSLRLSFFAKLMNNNKLDDEQKKPIVKLHWCVTSDTSYDKIKKTLSYNTI